MTAFVPPTHASASRGLLNADLDKSIPVAEVLELMRELATFVQESTLASVEHWTDDEGIHWQPLRTDLDSDTSAADAEIDRLLAEAIR